ncbi:MAG: carboxypeptidase-like regulatory domain-containing protein, partial [Bacteroidota bacterium]
MWKLPSLILFFTYAFSSYGQQKEVLGTIKNSKGDPVPFANVVVQDTTEAKNPITYGYTDEQGSFALEIPSKFQQILINVTAIGYEEKAIVVLLNQEQPLTIFLEESITQLGEVVVKARKVTDTLNIDTDGMNLSKESTLRDMLKKTDGIIIGEEGAISYQGKQINKVLINGKEVFVNQNNVALDNLNYEIMENVQIIDNYKDKFTLDFKRIRDPVINIETKSKFKGVLKTQVDMGYGF